MNFKILIAVLLVMGCVVGIAGATTYSANILPTMVSNTSPSPYFVNESAWYTAGDFSGYRAFDGSTATRYVPPLSKQGWVSIYLPTAPIVANYSIWADTLYNPVNWTFEGSNNRAAWTILDTKSSVAPWNLWASYPISNTQKYSYYRINVTNFTASAGSIYEVRMYTDTDYLYPYFTTNITYGNPGTPVQFTDSSVGSPVVWNWSFGDGTYSTLQNPSHTYTTWGIYNTSLQVSNATTNSSWSSNTTLYFQKSVVTIGDSIARGTEEVGRIWNPFGIGLAWYPEYSPPTPFGNGSYESEMQRNYTALSEWDWRYNMGWGGDTSTKLVQRWDRDALAGTNATVPGDILPPTTIDNKTPSLILLQIGINDIPTAPLSTTESNMMSVVTSANSHGIPIIVMGVFPDATRTTNITALNAWESATFNHNASMPNVRWVDAYTFLDDGAGSIKPEYRYYLDAPQTIHLNNSGYVALTNKIYTENSDLFLTLSADFHADTTTPAINQVVTFTDDSTDTPVNWYWDFGDGNISTDQNPTHSYAWVGSFSVNLSVSDIGAQSWMNKSNYITVHDLSGFNTVDLTMTPQYSLTLTIVDSATLLPIPVVTVTDMLGYNQTTTTGVFTHSYDYGTVLFYLISSGYDTRSYSVVMDSNRTETVTMTKTLSVAPNSNLNLLYPHEVQFSLADPSGQALSNVNVTAVMTSSSVENTNWYTTLFGISDQASSINGTTLYAISDDSGSFTMPMVSSGRYTMTFTSVVKGISESRTVSPQQANYVFILNPTASLIPNKGDYINGTLYQTEPNSSYVDLRVDYIDIGHTTTSMMFFVNDGTTGVRLYTSTVAGYIGNSSYSAVNTASASYVWGYYADSSTFGNVSEAQGIMMKGATGKMFNLDPCGGYALGWGNEC